MQDIRKPLSNSKSSIHHHGIVDLRRKVEEFEKGDYKEEQGQPDENVVSIERRKSRTHDIHAKDVYPQRRESDQMEYPSNAYIRGPRETRKGTGMFLLISGVIIACVLLMTFVLDSATVTIVPKFTDINAFSKSFIFNTGEEQAGKIPYIVATTTVTKSKKLPVSESKLVESKASGKIIIFNNYDSTEQKLLKNTRFEANNGKIYRINQSVTVPGKKGDTPGSIEVTVYADAAGATYNSDPTDFTIPGFKGTPRYALFFARSNGPISGGASGNVSLVSKPDLDAAKDELALETNKAIQEAFKNTKQAGYVPLKDAIKIVYEDNEKDLQTGQSSTYTVTGVGYMMLADESILASFIAQSVRDYKNESVRIDYLDQVTFTPKDTATIGTEKDTEVLVEGKPRIVWITDTDSVKKLLAGKSKSQFTTIMSGVPSIDKASNSFFPMWLSSFPSSTGAIKIVESIQAR